MKKYLMMGAAALVFGFAAVSCSSDDGVYNPNAKSDLIVANYNKAFINVFGQPAANQTWGFGAPTEARATRTAEPRGNEWTKMGYTIPADISTDEYNAVMQRFNTVGDESYESLVDWNTFFVQQVHKGTATYYPRNQYVDNDYSKGLKTGAQPIIGSDHMDWLCTVATQKEVIIQYWPLVTEIQQCAPYDDHIFDFNNSQSNDYGGRMLMVNSNTNIFGYSNSEDSKVHYNFRMEYIEPYGYFVGFDFYGNGGNPNQDIERDYIYNDWIVKIVPGNGQTPTVPSLRVMAEDLSAQQGTDFDFNDVVFDVTRLNGGEALITLQAAGGTLPLRIGNVVMEEDPDEDYIPTDEDSWEVHELFGVDTDMMVNTKAQEKNLKGTDKPAVSTNVKNANIDLIVTGDFPETQADFAAAVKNIRVWVFKEGKWFELKAEVGKPACKFGVPTDLHWAWERTNVNSAFNFDEWVQNPSAPLIPAQQ